MRIQIDANSILKEIEAMAHVKFLPIIGPVKGKYLVETVIKSKASRVLEVGTLVGYSAILIAGNLPDNGKVDTIEVNPQSARLAQDHIQRANLAHKISIHIGNALDVIPRIEGEFDLVFLDAAKNEYLRYLQICESKIKRNGVIFADNVKIFAAEMHDYLAYVRESGKYASQYIDAGFDGVEVSTKLF